MRDHATARGRRDDAPRSLDLLGLLEFEATKPESGDKMKLKTHPHMSDVLTLTHDDLGRIAAGEDLRVSALIVKLEKDDVVRYVWATDKMGHDNPINPLDSISNLPNMKLIFDGETGKLKTAEVL